MSAEEWDRSPYGSFRGQGYEGGRGFEGGRRFEGSGDEGSRRFEGGASPRGSGEEDGRFHGEGGRRFERGPAYEGGFGTEGRGGWRPGEGDSRGGEWDRGFRGGYSEDVPWRRTGRQGSAYGGYGGEYGYGESAGLGAEDRGRGGFERRSGSSTGGGYGSRGGESPSRWAGSGAPSSGRQSFAGRGPKGYRRSDERIREDVGDALERSAELDASEIEVQVAGGEVTLEGSVTDRRSKRLAEDLVEDLSGVKQVHNRLRVSSGSEEKRGLFGGRSDDDKDKEKEKSLGAEKTGGSGGSLRTPTA